MARQMKDSGVEWIGEIPETWEVTKAKFILSANDGGVWGNDPADDGNDKIVIRSTEQTIDGKWCIEAPAVRDLSTVPHASSRILPGDLLITKSSGSDLHIGKTTLADEYFEANECYFSNFIQRIRCKGYLPRLLWYLFNSNIVREQFVYLQNTTSGIGNINADIIDNLFLPNPPLMMQRRIADFLDRRCAEIDAVIERTRATIEEYKKLKQAVITEAVTKGVRGERKMKDSGIEWIGEIPEGWAVLPHKYVMHKEKSICEHYAGEDIISLTMNGVIVRDLTAGGKMPTTFDGYQYVEPDDMLLCLFDIDVTPRCVGIVRNHGVTSPAYSRFKVHVGYYNAYYDYLLRFIDDEKVFIHLSKNLRSSLTETDFGAIKTISPSYDEQVEIAAYLDEKCAALDTLIAKKSALLTELEAYKKSLIYEYVTGKKEVPACP